MPPGGDETVYISAKCLSRHRAVIKTSVAAKSKHDAAIVYYLLVALSQRLRARRRRWPCTPCRKYQLRASCISTLMALVMPWHYLECARPSTVVVAARGGGQKASACDQPKKFGMAENAHNQMKPSGIWSYIMIMYHRMSFMFFSGVFTFIVSMLKTSTCRISCDCNSVFLWRRVCGSKLFVAWPLKPVPKRWHRKAISYSTRRKRALRGNERITSVRRRAGASSVIVIKHSYLLMASL